MEALSLWGELSPTEKGAALIAPTGLELVEGGTTPSSGKAGATGMWSNLLSLFPMRSGAWLGGRAPSESGFLVKLMQNFSPADKTMRSELALLFTQGWHRGLSLNWVPPHCIALGTNRFKSKRSSHRYLLEEEGLIVSPLASVRPAEGRGAGNLLILHRREEAM